MDLYAFPAGASAGGCVDAVDCVYVDVRLRLAYRYCNMCRYRGTFWERFSGHKIVDNFSGDGTVWVIIAPGLHDRNEASAVSVTDNNWVGRGCRRGFVRGRLRLSNRQPIHRRGRDGQTRS